MNSKLDQALDWIGLRDEPYDGVVISESDKAEAKQQIKALFLELISAADPQAGKTDSKVYWGNVLRKSVEEL
jgi:hypothetical protein